MRKFDWINWEKDRRIELAKMSSGGTSQKMIDNIVEINKEFIAKCLKYSVLFDLLNGDNREWKNYVKDTHKIRPIHIKMT